MKKALAHSAIILAVLLGSAAAVVPATAGSSTESEKSPAADGIGTQGLSQCSEGYLCLWEHEDFGGAISKIPRLPVGQCYNVGVLDDLTSSLYNLSGAQVQVYTGSDCYGWGDDYFYQQKESSVGSHWIIFPFEDWNDQISSLKWF